MKPGQIILLLAILILHRGGNVFSQMSDQDMLYICYFQGQNYDLNIILNCGLGKLTPDEAYAAKTVFEQCVGRDLVDVFRVYCSQNNTDDIKRIKYCNENTFHSGRHIDVDLVDECMNEIYSYQVGATNKTDYVQKSEEIEMKGIPFEISGNIKIGKLPILKENIFPAKR